MVKKAIKMIERKQKNIIWAVAKGPLKMDDETLYVVIYRMFEKEKMSQLTYRQADRLIGELRRNAAGLAQDALTEPQHRKIMAMSSEFGWSASGLRRFLENEVSVSEVKWLNVQQARVAITGLEKIRTWREQNPQKDVMDGI